MEALYIISFYGTMMCYVMGVVVLNDVFFIYPSHLYNLTNMNKFGCYVCSFVIALLCPIYSVPAFIYWLFHIKKTK